MKPEWENFFSIRNRIGHIAEQLNQLAKTGKRNQRHQIHSPGPTPVLSSPGGERLSAQSGPRVSGPTPANLCPRLSRAPSVSPATEPHHLAPETSREPFQPPWFSASSNTQQGVLSATSFSAANPQRPRQTKEMNVTTDTASFKALPPPAPASKATKSKPAAGTSGHF